MQVSPDGGTTVIDVPDQAGVAITFTANGLTNFELYGNADIDSSEVVQLRLNLSGSTAPSLNYVIDDAR